MSVIGTAGDDAVRFAPVRGTCEDLEKDYLRLTAPPDPASVRPTRILAAALARLKALWRAGDADYPWMCGQLKAIRLDLTVQRVRTPFTVHVYETHARVALESADLNEYNQCQTQLRELYAATGLTDAGHQAEFVAYRVLYYLYLNYSGSTDAGQAELLKILAETPASARNAAPVVHALRVREALARGNAYAFFRLHAAAPNMGGYLLDRFSDAVRADAAAKILRAYRPTIPLNAVAAHLGFSNDVQDCQSFVTRLGFVFDAHGHCLCRESRCEPARLAQEGTSLL